jgi:uncharacterized membrane protein
MLAWFKKRKPLLPQAVQQAVAQAIAASERRSSGEIRVFVESHCAMVNPIHRCEEVFTQLKMHETKHRNGVLLYIAIKDRQFAIVGDQGIHEKIGGQQYWRTIADQMKQFFAAHQFQEGICYCVEAIGQELAQHYPLEANDNPNELPDEIVFGK